MTKVNQGLPLTWIGVDYTDYTREEAILYLTFSIHSMQVGLEIAEKMARISLN